MAVVRLGDESYDGSDPKALADALERHGIEVDGTIVAGDEDTRGGQINGNAYGIVGGTVHGNLYFG